VSTILGRLAKQYGLKTTSYHHIRKKVDRKFSFALSGAAFKYRQISNYLDGGLAKSCLPPTKKK
jgi:hypothetical protein